MPLSSSERDALRSAILADPCFLLEHVLGFQVRRHHRTWVEWTVRNPRSVNLAVRGAGKSYIMAGVIVWLILRDPNVRILVISKTEETATNLTGPVRAILARNDLLRQLFGKFLGARTWTDKAFTVAQRTDITLPEATVEVRGIDGQIAGIHADRVFIDDGQDENRAASALLSEHDWILLFKTIRPVLRRGGGIHINATPYEWDDLTGRIAALTGEMNDFNIEDVWTRGHPVPSTAWRILRTPAILRDGSSFWPEEFPLEDEERDGAIVEGLRSIQRGPAGVFETQYQVIHPRRPVEGELELVLKERWLTPWEVLPPRADLFLAMFIDPAWISAQAAATRSRRERDPDWFAIAIVGLHRLSRLVYVAECTRDRLSPLEGVRRALEIATRWKPDVIGVEDTNLQRSVPGAREFYDAIRAELRGYKVRFIRPQVKKTKRAEPFAWAAEAGRVRMPPGRPDIIRDAIYFGSETAKDERGEPIHDDTIDAIAGAYSLIHYRVPHLGAFLRQGVAAGVADAEIARRSAGAGSDAGILARRAYGEGAGDFSSRIVPRM